METWDSSPYPSNLKFCALPIKLVSGEYQVAFIKVSRLGAYDVKSMVCDNAWLRLSAIMNKQKNKMLSKKADND